MERPERPIEPHHWNMDFIDNELLEKWLDYIYELEDYVDELERRYHEIKRIC